MDYLQNPKKKLENHFLRQKNYKKNILKNIYFVTI